MILNVTIMSYMALCHQHAVVTDRRILIGETGTVYSYSLSYSRVSSNLYPADELSVEPCDLWITTNAAETINKHTFPQKRVCPDDTVSLEVAT